MKEEYSWTEKGTLYSNVYDDVFFHDGDGLEESEYVFLQGNNLEKRLADQNIIVGELGFGTGLNFLLTWQLWQKTGKKNGKRLTFISCEKHPLTPGLLEKSHAHFPVLKNLSDQLRSKWPPVETGFHLLEFEEGKVALLLLFGDCYNSLKSFEGKVDAWFLDGFSPAKNEEMWSTNVFKQLAWHSCENTTLATFTAAGFVRRGLGEVGFEVERVKGFGFKKHMTVGRYTGFVKGNLHLEPWYGTPEKLQQSKVAVIGAGMAGLNLAFYLERMGFDVSVFDSESAVSSKASGNKRGMIYPMISKKVDRLGALTEMGVHFTSSQVKELGVQFREGVHEFITDKKKSERFEEACGRYRKSYLELLSDPLENDSYKALFHKTGLSLSPAEYAEALQSEIKGVFYPEKRLLALTQTESGWELEFSDGKRVEFEAVFLAGAYEVAALQQADYLPLRRSRGQVIYLQKEDVNLRTQDLNYINYLTEADDCYVLGATFDVDDFDKNFRVEDSKKLLDSIYKTFPGIVNENLDLQKLSGRVCFRTVLKDHFPVVGAAPDINLYNKLYGDLKHGKPVSRYPQAGYLKNLYFSCGHGSRGFTFSPLSAAYLSRLLCDGIHILPVTQVQAIHPGRFTIKALKKK